MEATKVCFNRNIVECKGSRKTRRRRKTRCFNRNIVECKVRIDDNKRLGSMGFNRNIVECKGWTSGRKATGGLVLIETLWNVKHGRLQAV